MASLDSIWYHDWLRGRSCLLLCSRSPHRAWSWLEIDDEFCYAPRCRRLLPLPTSVPSLHDGTSGRTDTRRRLIPPASFVMRRSKPPAIFSTCTPFLKRKRKSCLSARQIVLRRCSPSAEIATPWLPPSLRCFSNSSAVSASPVTPLPVPLFPSHLNYFPSSILLLRSHPRGQLLRSTRYRCLPRIWRNQLALRAPCVLPTYSTRAILTKPHHTTREAQTDLLSQTIDTIGRRSLLLTTFPLMSLFLFFTRLLSLDPRILHRPHRHADVQGDERYPR
jgi:hypothetical protein